MIHAKGCKPTPHEMRRRFAAYPSEGAPHALATRLSYSGIFDDTDDQASTNSCVPHGGMAIGEAEIWKHFGVRVEMSWRGLYSLLKHLYEPTDLVDDGASVGEVLQVLQQFYVLESDWPSPTSDTADLFAPVPASLLRTDHPLRGFDAVQARHDDVRSALYHRGPVIIGGPWSPDWENPGPDGALRPDAAASSDGHCTVIVGYDDEVTFADAGWTQPGGFFGRNSWGSAWGKGGYYWMPYSVFDGPLAPWELYTVRQQ